jgi:hypothetical protein
VGERIELESSAQIAESEPLDHSSIVTCCHRGGETGNTLLNEATMYFLRSNSACEFLKSFLVQNNAAEILIFFLRLFAAADMQH